jgi:hypothetical protein
MTKRLVTIVTGALAMLGLLSAGAVAEKPESPGNSVAAQQCAAEKQSVGNKTFKQIYGKHAMKKCLAANADEAEVAADNAAKPCQAELDALGEEAFTAQYGTNPGGQNAFGKCVSQKAQAQAEEDAQETANAAKQCKAERAEMGPEAFAEEYGTNVNKKNAFGKCVSEKAQEDEEETPPTE